MLEFLLYIFLAKAIHNTLLWVNLFINEKIAIDGFIQHMYVNSPDKLGDGDEPLKPPPLWYITVRVFLADYLVIALIIFILYLMYSGSLTAPVVGGRRLFLLIAVDLLLTHTISFLVCLGIASASQKQTCCRYKDDGIRGIRAYCFTALVVTLPLSLLPFYLLVA